MQLIQSGNKFTLADLTAVTNILPVGVYLLQRNPTTGEYYLEQKDNFKISKKIYGDHSIVDRWLTSYQANPDKNS